MELSLIEDFPRSYEVESGGDLDPLGTRTHVFDDVAGGEGVVLKVAPAHGPAWWGVFSGGGQVGENCLRTTPNPDAFVVVLGGEGRWVPTLEPDQSNPLDCWPIMGCLSSTRHRLLLFASNVGVTAYSSQGKLWSSPRLSFDGLKDLELDAGRLCCRAWDAPEGVWRELAVDLETGRVVSGWVLPPLEPRSAELHANPRVDG